MVAKKRYRRRKPIRRRPILGVLAPQQSITIVIDPPMRIREQPAIFTPNATDLLMHDVQPNSVVLDNRTNMVVGYAFLVVPESVTRLAALPWDRILATAKREGGLFDQLKQLFGLAPPPLK